MPVGNGFDPKTYIVEKTNAFDPNQYLKEKTDLTNAIPPETAKSTYAGIPDDDLNLVQKAERGLVRINPSMAGHEMFSPSSMQAKKTAATAVVPAAGLIGVGMANPGLIPVIAKYGAEALGVGAGYKLFDKLLK